MKLESRKEETRTQFPTLRCFGFAFLSSLQLIRLLYEVYMYMLLMYTLVPVLVLV